MLTDAEAEKALRAFILEGNGHIERGMRHGFIIGFDAACGPAKARDFIEYWWGKRDTAY